jgi:hypothetical protein
MHTFHGSIVIMSKLQAETRWLLVLLALATVLVTRPSIHGNDGVQNYAYLRSLLFDGDLDFTNEYTHYFAKAAEWFDQKQIPRDATTGRPINLYGVGSALLWAPWVVTFHFIGKLATWGGVGHFELDGYSRLYEGAVGYASSFYAGLGVFLLYCTLARFFPRRRAFWAVLLVWLGSPLFFYAYFHPSMSHANSFFLSSLLTYLYFSRGNSVKRWIAMGLVSGLLILTRFQDGVLLAGLAAGEAYVFFYLLRRARGSNFWWGWLTRHAKRWFAAAGVTIFVCSLQCLVWWQLHGSPLSGPKGYLSQGQVHLLYPRHFWAALFSPFHGLFHWHPLLLIGLIGFGMRTSAARLRLYAILGFLAQAWVIGSWSIWWAGASFGQRMFISALPHLGVGMAATVTRLRAKREWLVAAIVCMAVLWNCGLVVQYATRAIPRQAPVTIITLARNNVIEVPRLIVKTLRGTKNGVGPQPAGAQPAN